MSRTIFMTAIHSPDCDQPCIRKVEHEKLDRLEAVEAWRIDDALI